MVIRRIDGSVKFRVVSEGPFHDGPIAFASNPDPPAADYALVSGGIENDRALTSGVIAYRWQDDLRL